MIVGANVLGYSRGGCILDVLSGGVPQVAYGLRRLTASYNGKCLNVRRSSDNSAMDIGFRGNSLDMVTLLAFVGSGSGYITTWYNQGALGSSGNASQGTAANQPTIVAAGSLVTQNGLPAMSMSSTSQKIDMPMAAQPSGSASNSVNIVAAPAGTSAVGFWYYLGTNSGHGARTLYTPTGTYYRIWDATTYVGTGNIITTSTAILTALWSVGTSYLFMNGTQEISTTSLSALNTVPLSSAYVGGLIGTMSEFIATISTTWSTADRQLIEHNQESYFSITGV
jgi:hypothetical protein